MSALSERWAHTERNLMSAYERWTQKANERKRNVKNERTVKDMWTQDNQFIRSAPGVILILYFVGYQENITNKLHYV